MAPVEPILELQPEGGQVVVTRFECQSRVQLLYLVLLHMRVKREVRRLVSGLVASTVVVDWRRRTLLSISLWDDLDSVYTMGRVEAHVAVTRIPRQVGIRTACGVFCFAGDWRRVMFRTKNVARSPLRPLEHQADASAAGTR